MALAVLAVVIPTLLVSPFASRSDALNLANHPLLIQLGTSNLPYGSFHRCLLARDAIMQGLNDGMWRERSITPQSAVLLQLIHTASQQAHESAEGWRADANSAGKSIELPPSEIEAGVTCYNCGGNHYNIDCPEENTAASPSAMALASYFRSTTHTLAAASAVLNDFAFASNLLLRADLDGGDAYGRCLRENAKSLAELSDACNEALEASDAATEEDHAAAEAQASTARALLYAFIDSEASDAGLKTVEMKESGVSLQEARERLDAIEPGFLQSQDKNAQFLEVLGAQGQKTGSPAATAAGKMGKKAAAVDAAAAYLAAKQAAQKPVGSSAAAALRDAQAALAASKGGSKQAAAKTYLAMRSKQKAAEAYLAARKANTKAGGASGEGEGDSGSEAEGAGE